MLLAHRLLTILLERVGVFHAWSDLAYRIQASQEDLLCVCRDLIADAVPLQVEEAGCYLSQYCELWSTQRLYDYLDTQSIDFSIHKVFRVASTNVWAMSCVRAEDWRPQRISLFLCEQQTQGRGRYGRRWVAPLLKTICMSYVWHSVRLFSLSALTVMIAYTVMLVLRGLGYAEVMVKWPNDLVIGGHKCGGILIEKHGAFYIIGIGLNTVSHDDFIGLSAHSTLLRPPSRHALLSQLLLALRDALQYFDACGFIYYTQDWQCDQYWYQRYVRFVFPSGACVGRVVGIDHNGFLLLQQTNGQVSAYPMGEVKGCLVKDPSCS